MKISMRIPWAAEIAPTRLGSLGIPDVALNEWGWPPPLHSLARTAKRTAEAEAAASGKRSRAVSPQVDPIKQQVRRIAL